MKSKTVLKIAVRVILFFVTCLVILLAWVCIVLGTEERSCQSDLSAQGSTVESEEFESDTIVLFTSDD